MTMNLKYRAITALLVSSVFAVRALAAPAVSLEQQPNVFAKTKIQTKTPVSSGAPVLLNADQVEYDQEASIVTASGHVEISQGDTVILCDRLHYDQGRNIVKARGNVSMMESSGTVYFADEVELTDDLKAGLIRQFAARLSDNSLFVAAGARKIDENRIELGKAVYSPCKVTCDKDGSGHDPMWQMRADHVLVDDRAQKVSYENAYFDVYGLPILYTPYFSHPTPDAENESGLLTPEFQQSGNLGSVFKVPVYYAIAPDKDVTLVPIYTTQESLIMAGEYRQRLDSGRFALTGSVTRPQERDASGSVTSGNQVRGHIKGDGKFDISEDYDWGFNVNRATDDTYLRRYGFGEDTLLTSKVYAEGYNFIQGNERTYGSVQAVSFQGLTAQDDAKRIPVILPMADISYETDPLAYNSRAFLSGNALALSRDIGANSRRLSTTGGWRLPYITDGGQVIEFSTQLRTDIYSVEDVTLSDGRSYDGTTGRVVPQASLQWRYPFITQGESSSLMLEPVAQFAISPGGGNPEKIPNEDSLVPEFTDTNLFSTDRYAGYDRVENGPRLSYGLRGQAQLFTDQYVDWLLGQHYRMNDDRNFPFSNDLTSNFSDYVGRVGLHFTPYVDVAYRFRADKDTLIPKRQEVDASASYYPVSVYASYLSLQNDPVLASKEELFGGASLNLTREWMLNFNGRRDLELDYLSSVGSGLTFKNECTSIMAMLGKEYTRDRDVKPSTTFLFRVALKNLE